MSETRKRTPTYENRVLLTVRIDKVLHAEIQAVAKQARKPLNTYICDLIDTDLKLKAQERQFQTDDASTTKQKTPKV